MHLVDTWELFRPTRDETFVDQKTRYVDLHRPDGKADLLQQIEQGALGLVAQHRAFGRAIQTIIAPQLHQYHHLGDWSTQTDGLPYDPSLAPYESNGKASGTPDDRWAFTEKSAATNYASSAALAAASRALRGYDDALAAECLAAARKAWSDERAAKATETGWEAMFRQGAELGSTLQLLMATKEKPYADRFQELVWPALERAPGFTVAAAVRAIPFFGPSTRSGWCRTSASTGPRSTASRRRTRTACRSRGAAGPATRRSSAGPRRTTTSTRRSPRSSAARRVLDGLTYILGRHPASNLSFVSGVGTRSKRVAYGQNRAEFTFIAGGVVPGVLVLKPDLPESQEDWPFLWGENEYVVDICAHWIFLANAANDLLRE